MVRIASGLAHALRAWAAREVPGPRTRQARRTYALFAGTAAGLAVGTDQTVLASIPPGDRGLVATVVSLLTISPLVIAVLACVAMAVSVLSRSGGPASPVPPDEDVPGLSTMDWMTTAATAAFVIVDLAIVAAVPVAVGRPLGEEAQDSLRSTVSTAAMVGVLLGPLTLPPAARKALAGVQAAALLISLSAMSGRIWPEGLEVSAALLSTSLFFVAGIGWLLTRSQDLDRAHGEERRQRRALAHEEARERARNQVDDFIHDHILSALLPLASELADDALVRSAAWDALRSLEEGPADGDASPVTRVRTARRGGPRSGEAQAPAAAPASGRRGGDGHAPADRSPSAWSLDLPVSMETPTVRRLGVLLIAVSVLHAWVAGDFYLTMLPVAAALLCLAAAMWLLTRSWPDARLPAWAAVLIPVLVGALNLACLWAIPPGGWPGYASWSLGAGVTLCWGLLMRERRLAAWTGFGLLAATTFHWVLGTGQPLAMAPRMLASHLISLIAWNLIAVWSTRFSRQAALSGRRVGQLAALREVQRETARLTALRMESVARRSRPLLERIVTAAAMTPQLRLEARLLEAELRDEIRGRLFTGTPVVAAARSARQRGADVVLVDDSGPAGLAPADREAVVGCVCRALEAVTTSRVVVRVLPPQRPHLASVAVDGAVTVLPRRSPAAPEPARPAPPARP
jgi:hypothetical protein